MSLAYESSEGMPSFVQKAINRWSVHPETEATCLVRTHATLELRGPLRLLQFLLEGRLQAHGGDCDVSGCCRVEGDAHLPCLPAVSFET
jgi:hypothetical protein